MRLLIYIEPTSYLIPLWNEIKMRSKIDTQIIFLEENFSQSWNIKVCNDEKVKILRGNWIKKLLSLMGIIWRQDVELVALAGWGHSLLIASLLFARVARIPVTIESDTPLYTITPRWKRILKRMVFRVFFRIPKIFFPAGTRQAAYFKHYGVSQERIRIAQMTVDVCSIMHRIDHYREKKGMSSGSDKHIVFLYVGRLEIHKGISDLLEAFINLVNEGRKCRLIIVGDGSLRDLVESARNTHNTIEYLGRLSGESLMYAYSRVDVFILPSRVEPWGLVINEAMSAGLAVITTDNVGCVDDLVRDGKNGYIVPSASPARLAEAMRTFIHQPEMAVSMGQISRQIISNWTIETEAQILITAWNELQ